MGEKGAGPRIQSSNLQHLFEAEFEVEDVNILLHALFSYRLSQRNDTALVDPTKHNLAHAFTVLFPDTR